MIESGLIIELSNNKKYIIADNSIENGKIYYMALEVEYDTEVPTDNSIFFEHGEDNTLIPIVDESDIDFLKTIFVNKFLENFN